MENLNAFKPNKDGVKLKFGDARFLNTVDLLCCAVSGAKVNRPQLQMICGL